MDDEVRLMPYFGEKHGHHKKKRAYSPILMSYMRPSRKVYEHKQFVKIFTTEMQAVNLLYDQDTHGDLRVMGRFGKVYYFDVPPHKDMTVSELQEHEEKNRMFVKGKRHFRSSFIPQRMNHKKAEEYLLREDYQFVAEDKRITIQLNPKGYKGQHPCNIVQDGRFNFIDFRYPDVKWVLFNVIHRQSSGGRDVRVAVESVRETKDASDPGVTIYKNAKILKRGLTSTHLQINEEFTREVSFVREKITRKFKKLHETNDDFSEEIHLIRSREYSKLNERTGVFQEIKDWREELVFQANISNLHKIATSEEFPRYFIGSCVHMQGSCE